MKALEILESLIKKVFYLEVYRSKPVYPGKPGEMIEKLAPEQRQELAKLSSADLGHQEVPRAEYYCDKFYEDRMPHNSFTKDKLDFDKKILK